MSADAWPAGLPTRLRPVEVVGRGTQGVVWAARDTATGRDVAIKLIAAPEADRFETEARALARLRGVPGIVGVVELGRTARGVGWLVTELVPGGTLADRGQSTLRVPELAAIGERLATGLAIAHERGVHHGDITPPTSSWTRTGAPSWSTSRWRRSTPSPAARPVARHASRPPSGSAAQRPTRRATSTRSLRR